MLIFTPHLQSFHQCLWLLTNILKRQTREESKLLKKNHLFLKSKKLIHSIFENGKYFKEYPLSVRFLQVNEVNDINFVISVKKKYLPKAVDRNKIKRLMRKPLQNHLQFTLRQNIIHTKN